MRTVTLRLLPPLLLFRLSACAEPPPSLPPASPIDWGTGLSVDGSAASSACCAPAWLGTSAKAFDGTVGTQYTEYYWWHSGYDSSDGSWVGGTYPSCTPQWLSFEFNDPVILSGYRITSRGLTAYAETDSPKGWALQWSVNGSPPWITVQRVTDEPTWLPLTSREFVVPLAPASKYYRLYFENDAQHNDIGGIHPSDGPRCVVVLAELELFAAFPAPPSPPPPTPPTLPPLPPIAPIDWGTRLIPSSTYVSSQHDTDTTSCGGRHRGGRRTHAACNRRGRGERRRVG